VICRKYFLVRRCAPLSAPCGPIREDPDPAPFYFGLISRHLGTSAHADFFTTLIITVLCLVEISYVQQQMRPMIRQRKASPTVGENFLYIQIPELHILTQLEPRQPYIPLPGTMIPNYLTSSNLINAVELVPPVQIQVHTVSMLASIACSSELMWSIPHSPMHRLLRLPHIAIKEGERHLQRPQAQSSLRRRRWTHMTIFKAVDSETGLEF